MTTRGKVIKTDTPERQTLLRPMVTRRYELVADHTLCCGCSICVTVCPREAITLSAAALAEGRLTARPRIDIEPDKCNFCGECVALCPTHALSMTVNGEVEVPVLKGKAFPMLIRTMRVDQAICEATADAAYIENCPTGAISGEIVRDVEGGVQGVLNAQVARDKCINCTHCMEQGPKGAFAVVKPYQGRVLLDESLCPAGCQACADVCPSRAITYDGQRVHVDRRFCLFCSACENVCPAPGAIRIVRTGFVHTPIQSGAWAKAVEKLVSYQEVAREYDVKGQAKRREAVLGALLPEMAKE
jgi:4Fe-4S ferredoxin